jgi:hypothetical protein
MKNVDLDLEPIGEWEVFRSFPKESAAIALRGQLTAGDCPAKVSPRALDNAVETEYCVFVPKSLVHRARWIVAQLPISDEELEFLATGKLPASPQDTD